MNNTSSSPAWERIEVCYFEDLDCYTDDTPQRANIENPEDINEMASIIENTYSELTATSKPMGFPRYVVTFHGEDSTCLCFSVDAESVFSANFLESGNYFLPLESKIYSEVSTLFASLEQTEN